MTHSQTRQRTARMVSHRRAQEHRWGAGGSPIMIPTRRLVPMALRRRRRQHRQRLRLGECQLIRRASQPLVWPVPALHQVGHLGCHVATPDPMARIGQRRAGWTTAEGAAAINKVIVPMHSLNAMSKGCAETTKPRTRTSRCGDVSSRCRVQVTWLKLLFMPPFTTPSTPSDTSHPVTCFASSEARLLTLGERQRQREPEPSLACLCELIEVPVMVWTPPAHRGLSRWRVLLAYRMNDPCGGPRATLVGSHGVCRISRKAPAAFRYIRLPSPAGRRSKLYLICFLCRSSN